MRKPRYYFDYAASTPVAPEVEAAMRPYFLKKFGNAGSLHSFGQEALAALDASRETIAKTIGRRPASGFREIIFTGSATEANNLAVRGVLRGVKSQKSSVKKSRIIVSAIEHESVLETARDLARDGVDVVIVPVGRNGIIDLKKLESALDERTVLVSVMYANNEIGTVQPISEIGKLIRNFRNRNFQFSNLNFQKNSNDPITQLHNYYPLFHTDAAQAFPFLDCDADALGVDLMTLSAHKMYGPKGVGCLYVRDVLNVDYNKRAHASDRTRRTLEPLITGGGQEFGLRSGTENVALAVGFAKAAERAAARRIHNAKKVAEIKNRFWRGLKKIYPDAAVNGANAPVAPHILNVYFPRHNAEDLLVRFDMAGIAVSSGSACSARSTEPSYVIRALGYPGNRAWCSIRFSFGLPTATRDIDSALRIIGKLL